MNQIRSYCVRQLHHRNVDPKGGRDVFAQQSEQLKDNRTFSGRNLHFSVKIYFLKLVLFNLLFGSLTESDKIHRNFYVEGKKNHLT